MKLLIVEDEKSLARALGAILGRSGYSTDTVFDGESALEYILTGKYDGVILDVMLPGMDGLAVLKSARSRGCTVPVLILTAKSEIDDKVEGLDSGANDYLIQYVRQLYQHLRCAIIQIIRVRKRGMEADRKSCPPQEEKIMRVYPEEVI